MQDRGSVVGIRKSSEKVTFSFSRVYITLQTLGGDGYQGIQTICSSTCRHITGGVYPLLHHFTDNNISSYHSDITLSKAIKMGIHDIPWWMMRLAHEISWAEDVTALALETLDRT